MEQKKTPKDTKRVEQRIYPTNCVHYPFPYIFIASETEGPKFGLSCIIAFPLPTRHNCCW